MRFIQSSVQKLVVILFCVATAPSVFAEQDDDIYLQNNKSCLPHGANVALSLGGGGFLSTTEMSGFTAGLLAYAMKHDKTNALIRSDSPLLESDLFGGVKSINSISGGSWFAALLIYSEKYRTTTESLAKTYIQSPHPDRAIAEVSKTFREGDSFTKLVDRAESTAAKLLGPKLDFILNLINADISERLKQLLGLLLVVSRNQDKPINWKTFIDDFVLDDIKGTKFKDDVQEWAKGKTWRIIVTAVTPKEPDSDFIYVSKNSLNFLNYTMHPKPEYDAQPVLFSAVLGFPEAAACKYDPSSPKNALRLKNVVYEGQDINELFWLDKENTKMIKSTGGIDGDMLLRRDKARNFSEMPIVGPVSASSAALGLTTEAGKNPKKTAELFGTLGFLDPSVYFAPKANQEDAFDKPTKIMSDIWKSKDPTTERIQELADIGAHELADGGALDGSGIATAVATGAKDVFVLNVVNTTNSFQKYFSGFINSNTGQLGPRDEVSCTYLHLIHINMLLSIAYNSLIGLEMKYMTLYSLSTFFNKIKHTSTTKLHTSIHGRLKTTTRTTRLLKVSDMESFLQRPNTVPILA